MRIREFEEGDIEAAGSLLAERGRRQRAAQPLLPDYLAIHSNCIAAIAELYAGGARGAVAYDGDRLSGYILATRGEGDRGPHTWVPPEGYAQSEPEALRRIYAELAQGWIDEGRNHHYVEAASDDDNELTAWLHLGFGYEQAMAVRRVEPSSEAASEIGSTNIRAAGPDDIDALDPLLSLIGQAHRASPTFAYVDPSFFDGLREGHFELITDDKVGYLIAEEDGQVLAYAAFYEIPQEEATWYFPSGSLYLIVAATMPQARGRGLMRGLFSEGLRWGHERGYQVTVTDWRVPNLDSSRTWPRLGYETVAYRLHRIVDPRIVGA